MRNAIFFATAFFCATLAFVPSSRAGMNDCTPLCSLNAATAKNYISDGACKNDPTCVSCVANAVTGGQSGAYCTAAADTKKGAGIETLTAVLNTAASVACGVACFTVVGDRMCGIGGLAVMATEVASTIASLGKGDEGLMSLVGMAGQFGTVTSNLQMARILKDANGNAIKTSNMAACVNMGIYGLTAYMKYKSKSSMEKTHDEACLSAQQLAASATGATQACLKGANPAAAKVLDVAGLFSPTKDNSYPTPKIDDIDSLAATSGSSKFLKDMKDDLKKAETMGKLDMADIAKRVEAGEKPSSILASLGGSGPALDELKRQEERIDRGEKSPLLAALAGDATYAGNGGAVAKADSGSGFGEMGFGGGATPSEGATDTLEIERKPAGAKQALGAGDDVFHAAFGGTIFDIVSLRIQESKGTYAELEPEGRLNRAFNGYAAPSARAPAAAQSRKTSNHDAK